MYSHLFTVTVHTPVYSYLLHICSNILHTCSGWQKMWASSCWNLRTRVSPLRAPESSFLCNTPKSAILSGNSRHERWRWSNIKLKSQNTGVKTSNTTQLQQPKHVWKKEKEMLQTSVLDSSSASGQIFLSLHHTETCCPEKKNKKHIRFN